MLVIVELALFTFGIVVLVRGCFQLTKNKVVVGSPATAIGVILAVSLPGIFFIEMAFPVIEQILFGGVPNPAALYFWFELLIILGVVAVVLAIAVISGKPSQKNRGNRKAKHD